MEFIKPGININFIGRRRVAYILSVVMIIATVLLLFLRGGPNYGVDFTGGVLIQVKMEERRTPAEIREVLRQAADDFKRGGP